MYISGIHGALLTFVYFNFPFLPKLTKEIDQTFIDFRRSSCHGTFDKLRPTHHSIVVEPVSPTKGVVTDFFLVQVRIMVVLT